MNILGIDSSTTHAAIGISRDSELLGEATIFSMETHSARLLPTIDYVLQSVKLTIQEIDLFAVTTGPGSFTGLRVGFTTAKGFAWSTKKPLVALNSLEVLAQNLLGSNIPIVPMLDARKKRVYGAVYRWTKEELEVITPPCDINPVQIIEQTSGEVISFGSGARKYEKDLRDRFQDRVQFPAGEVDYPRGSSLNRLALNKFNAGDFVDLYRSEPDYLRKSEAELITHPKSL